VDECRPFSGAKIVLHANCQLVAYLRDAKPTIPFPGQWDLPGAGREGDETPDQCALREVREEFGLQLPVARISWRRRYSGKSPEGLASWFLAAPLRHEEIAQIIFGDEGQHWRMMGFEEFLRSDNAVPDLQLRLREFVSRMREDASGFLQNKTAAL
jgi:8-oxo-dGTP diphosphatase